MAAPASAARQNITGFSIDSRTLRPGEVFIAIKGPNYDGHDFVAQALESGAALALVRRERLSTYDQTWQSSLMAVPDTCVALQQLGLFARRVWRHTLIGLTGSTGKTTTKEMLAALLASRHRVLKSEGNLNNEYGVPLTLLRLEPEHEVTVLEMAMSHKGELAKLCRVAEPNVGVVTNVAPVHLEFFSSVEEIAEAKRELVEGLTPPATAVLNSDDPRVCQFGEGFSGKVVRFSMETPADVWAENLTDHGCLGTEFDLVTRDHRSRVRLPLPGRAQVANALAAYAAARLQGVEPDQAADVFNRIEPAPLRGVLMRFAAGFTVVNDAYNSNPCALAAMAEALSRTPGAGRRILVAGEMKELGETSGELHRSAGLGIASLGNIDILAGVTGDARHIVEGAVAAGMSSGRARFFEDKESAGEWLCSLAEPGDWILLKASRGVELETLLGALQARFAEPGASAGLSPEPAGLRISSSEEGE